MSRAQRTITSEDAVSTLVEAEVTPVLFAENAAEAEHYRHLLEAAGITAFLGETDRIARRGRNETPLLVAPTDLERASELIAAQDAHDAQMADDWEEDEEDDDFDDDDEDDEDDDFLPDDDDADDDEEFDDDADD